MELKKIQKIYENLPDDSTEEDVKIHVIVDMLQILGYKKEWMKFEAREKDRKGVTDILINLPKGEKIIVEVKSKKSILNDESKGQLLNYLTNKDSRLGILTNGNQFLLVDNTIKVTRNIDKYFLEVSLDNNCKMNLTLFNFFSYKYIFDLKTTQYFELYKSYAVNKFIDRKSIIESQYRSACYIFFSNIANKEYSTLELSLNNFENMVLKNNWSKETIKNKYRYIRSFLDYLEREKYIEKNRFDLYGLKKIIEKVENKDLKSNIKVDSYVINKMKNYYVGIDSKNEVITLLFLYTLNYELIINLKRDDYSLLNNILNNGNDKLNYKHKDDEDTTPKCKHNIKDLYNRASKLSSISNCEIDKAKKNFEDLRVNRELDSIKEDLVMVKDIFDDKKYSEDKRRVKPLFFKVIGDTKALKERRLTDKKELEKRNSIAVEKYIEDKKLKKEDVINKKGKVNKEHIELINILNNIKKEWEVWKDKIYVEYATPMDYLQVELDKIKDSKRSKNIYLRDLLKEVKHKADKEEINKLALQIEDLDKKLKAINLNVDMAYKDKVITKEELKRNFVIYIREQKLTKAKIYHLLKRCFKIKKNNKEEKEVIKGIENITIEIMFRTYGDKFIDMFKSYTK